MQELLLQFISFGSILIFIFIISYLVLEIFKIKNPIKSIFQKYPMHFIYITSFGASIGSILLTAYFQLAPCELCWYQRSFLFAIPVISLIALIKKDTFARIYVFYLSIMGGLFALYHSILQAGVLKSDSVFCSSVSSDCITPAFTYFGFVTIPVIALSVFLLLIIMSYESKKIL